MLSSRASLISVIMLRIIKVCLVALVTFAPISTYAAEKQSISIEALVANGYFNQARKLLDAATKNDPKRKLLLNHLEGLIHLKKGEVDQAIARFRQNLSDDPDFWQSRNFLAQALFQKGDAEGFTYHANRVISGPINEELKEVYIRALAKTSHGKPWGIQTRFSVLPSTNINRGSGHETFVLNGREFTINEGSKLKSGIGFSAGATAFVKKQLNERSSLAFIASADGQKFSQTSLNDQFILGGKIAYTQNFAHSGFSFGPQVKFQWDAWKPSKLSYGAFGSFSHRFNAKTSLFVNANIWKHEYQKFDINDGYSFDVAATLGHQVNPYLGLSLTVSVARDVKDELGHLSYWDKTVRTGFSKEWEGGAISSIFASYGQRDFDENFPLHGYEREDSHYSVGFKLKHRKLSFKGFVPELRYEYTKQESNVIFYDYDSHDVSVSLTKAF